MQGIHIKHLCILIFGINGISVFIFHRFQYILVLGKEHVLRILFIVIQRSGHSHRHGKHHHDKENTEKQNQVVGYILEDDAEAEPAQEFPFRQSHCLLALRLL